MSSGAARQIAVMDVEGFLAFLDGRPRPERWELHDGLPRLMVGGTACHARIAGNIDRSLFAAARAHGCEVIRGLLVQASLDSAYDPDVLIRCGPIDPLSRKEPDPRVVFEVLSPSTMRYDRGLKFDGYRALPGLDQIVFVYQDSYRVESWLRRDAGWAEEPVVLTRLDGSLAVPVIGASVGMAEIYLDVTPSPMG